MIKASTTTTTTTTTTAGTTTTTTTITTTTTTASGHDPGPVARPNATVPPPDPQGSRRNPPLGSLGRKWASAWSDAKVAAKQFGRKLTLDTKQATALE